MTACSEPSPSPYRSAVPPLAGGPDLLRLKRELAGKPLLERQLVPSYAHPPKLYMFTTFALALPAALYMAMGHSLLGLFALALSPLMALAVDRLLFQPRVARAFLMAQEPLAQASSRWQLDQAEAGQRAQLPRWRSRPGLQATILFNLSVLHYRRCDLPGAMNILVALSRFKGTRLNPLVKVMVPLHMAMYWTQLGDLDEALVWLRRYVAAGRSVQRHSVEAMMLTRLGRYADAEANFAYAWPDLERVLSAEAMRVVRVRRAFALELADAAPARVQALLNAAQPTHLREYEPLAIAWPELRRFLEKHKLIAR